jgi:hypothetical protein
MADEPEFFIDRSLGRRAVPDALRACGLVVHTMADVYGEQEDRCGDDTGRSIADVDLPRSRNQPGHDDCARQTSTGYAAGHRRRPVGCGPSAADLVEDGRNPGQARDAGRDRVAGTRRGGKRSPGGDDGRAEGHERTAFARASSRDA